MFVARHDRLVVTVSAREPSLIRSQRRLCLLGLIHRAPPRDLAHDRKDLLHDITAGAAGSISQQILHRAADLCFGVVRARKLRVFDDRI